MKEHAKFEEVGRRWLCRDTIKDDAKIRQGTKNGQATLRRARRSAVLQTSFFFSYFIYQNLF